MKTIRRGRTDAEKKASRRGRQNRKKGNAYNQKIIDDWISRGLVPYWTRPGNQSKGGSKQTPDAPGLAAMGIEFHVEGKKGNPSMKKAYAQALQKARPGLEPVAVCWFERGKFLAGNALELAVINAQVLWGLIQEIARLRNESGASAKTTLAAETIEKNRDPCS